MDETYRRLGRAHETDLELTPRNGGSRKRFADKSTAPP